MEKQSNFSLTNTLKLLIALTFLTTFSASAQTFSSPGSFSSSLSQETSAKALKRPANFAKSFVSNTNELANWKAAARFARDNKTKVQRLLKSQDDSVDGEETKNLNYIILANQDSKILKTYFTDGAIDAAEEKEIRREINAIVRDTRMSPGAISLFLSGDAKTLATNSSPQSSNNAAGSIGGTYSSAKSVISARITVASTIDTLSSEMGSFMLSPANGKTAKSGLLDFFYQVGSPNNWLHFYGSLASSTWKIEEDVTTKKILAKSASTMGFGALYRYQLVGGMLEGQDKFFGLDAEIGVAGRYLGGDLTHLDDTDEGKAKIKKIFGSDRRNFYGLEGGLTLTYGQLTGSLQGFYMFPKKNQAIDGLTGLQVMAGISIRADLITGVFK